MASVLQGGDDAGGNPRRTDYDKFSAGKQQKERKIAKHVVRNSVKTPAVTNGVANPSSPSYNPIDALLTFRESSRQNRCIEPVNAEVMPGYTRFDNRVRISLNTRSKSGIQELTTKLRGELDQVRSLVKKFEAQELQLSGYGGDFGHSQSQFSANNLVERVDSTLKANSEVGSAYLPESRLVRSVSVAENFGEFAEKEMNKHKNSKYTPTKELPLPDCNLDGGKILGPVLKICSNLLERLMKHKFGWVFNVPVDAKRLGLHDYLKIITKPMDLGTVKMRLNKNWYKSPKEFAEDVRLTFSNAITYNPKGEDVHIMAEQLSKIFEEKWKVIEGKQNDGSVLPTPISRKSPVLATPPMESRTFSRSDSTTKPPPANRGSFGKSDSATKPPPVDVVHPDKKPKAKNQEHRDMTYEEKQKLSIDLQDLPSDKLNNVVKIIKKRNQGLFQNDDEIELDIGSVDSETLWELERFVANYKRSLIKNKRKADANLQSGEKSSHYSTKDTDPAGEPLGGNADSENDSSSTCGDGIQSPSG